MRARSVLIIDDSPAFQSITRTSFERAGWRVGSAESLDSAAEALARGTFAAVVLDFRFPKGDGLELLERIRNDGLDVAVVMVSGDVDFKTGITAMKLGADDFLEKPVPMDDLVDTVDAAVARRAQPGDPTVPASHQLVADLIMHVATASRDTRRVADWARTVALSRQVLLVKCSRVGTNAKRALDLGRLLRVCLQAPEIRRVEWQLDTGDHRTLAHLIQRTGLSVHDLEQLPPDAFLQRQQLIESQPLVEALRVLVRKTQTKFGGGGGGGGGGGE
jgi:DNA-binding response OmpR family regulator